MTYKLTDQHIRVLCGLIGEVYHELSHYGAFCITCDEFTHHGNHSNRTFTTGNDMIAVKEALVAQGKWEGFERYAGV